MCCAGGTFARQVEPTRCDALARERLARGPRATLLAQRHRSVVLDAVRVSLEPAVEPRALEDVETRWREFAAIAGPDVEVITVADDQLLAARFEVQTLVNPCGTTTEEVVPCPDGERRRLDLIDLRIAGVEVRVVEDAVVAGGEEAPEERRDLGCRRCDTVAKVAEVIAAQNISQQSRRIRYPLQDVHHGQPCRDERRGHAAGDVDVAHDVVATLDREHGAELGRTLVGCL